MQDQMAHQFVDMQCMQSILPPESNDQWEGTADRTQEGAGKLCHRKARLDGKDAGMQLRVAGTAMLVSGRMRATHEQEAKPDAATAEGPCMLPPQPAVYACLSPVKVITDPNIGTLPCFVPIHAGLI